MNKKNWVKALALLPVLLYMMFINYSVDPANIYHDGSKEIAESLLEGQAASFGVENGNEREIKRNLIIGMPEEVDCIAVGPSLVMGVRADMVGTSSYYNLGESAADFYDILAQFGLMRVYGKSVRRVVFCVDSFFFDEALNSTFTQNEALKPYAQYMMDFLDGKRIGVPEINHFASSKKKFEQLFSVAYYQASLEQIRQSGWTPFIGKRWIKVPEGYQGAYYCADGSWVYAQSYRNNGVDFVLDQAKGYNIRISRDGHISEYQCGYFEKLVCYLISQDVEIDLFLCPLSPALYDRIMEEKARYPILDELEGYARGIAEKYDLKITGSYNPHVLNMKNEDFYDSRHVRHELLTKYFDFKAEER